jgi:hypothetical protein
LPWNRVCSREAKPLNVSVTRQGLTTRRQPDEPDRDRPSPRDEVRAAFGKITKGQDAEQQTDFKGSVAQRDDEVTVAEFSLPTQTSTHRRTR